jgi:hypothetical protein
MAISFLCGNHNSISFNLIFHFFTLQLMAFHPHTQARDMGVLFVSVQLIIAGIAKLIHMLDVGNQIPEFFPKEWAARNATVLAVGPYYCSGATMFFALIGLIALICGTQNLASAITRPRTRNLDLCFCCDPRSCACVCDGARVCDAFSNAHACSECGTCGTCGTCASSDTAAACGALLLVMILVLAVLGVFVAIFFGTVILQQVMYEHMRLLALSLRMCKLDISSANFLC